MIHDITDASANGVRTPSRAGERKLPDIPRGNSFLNSNSEQNNGSDLYATLGSGMLPFQAILTVACKKTSAFGQFTL